MKKYLPLVILLTLSILFYWISAKSYALQSSELESMELFRLFRGISNVIALFVPFVLFVFYMLTSSLMFTILDEKFDSRKMAWTISRSFLPVILNCLVYLLVLYGIDQGGNLQEMLNQKSLIGLSLGDMEEVSYIFWAGFYLFLIGLIWQELGVSLGKAVGIAVIPTLLVVGGRYLFGII